MAMILFYFLQHKITKKLLDNDQGPNTGGMGAYAPSSLANESLLRKVQKDIILPTLAGMKKEGAEFCGVFIYRRYDRWK